METMLIKQAEESYIRTPDQRLRVFVSSSLRELAPEREVVHQAIEQLHLIPVMFESGARPHPPQELYRSYLTQSHIFIGIYWESYGWVAPGMEISGLEDEYQLGKNLPKLIYIKHPAPKREPALEEMLQRVKGEEKVCYKYFSSPEELGKLISGDIVLLLSERFEQTMVGSSLPSRQAAVVKNNLPQELTPFIGREQLMASISQLLEKGDKRLVTLSGLGGVGKTRLALKVASEHQGLYPDGVWLVELGSFSDPSLVVRAAADVFSLREEQSRSLEQILVDYLYDKNLMIVLDNCEHMVDAAARLVETILKGAPGVQVIATSRELLGVAGEVSRGIPPLSIPDLQDETSVEELRRYEAINLFIERAFEVKPDFTLSDLNAAAVAKICARLDGIPLAIELAAARLRVLPVEEIAAKLDDRFRFLVGNHSALPRQQTLRALIDWSYDLLQECERILFRRLSVFSGGWTVEAAEFVCSGEGIEQDKVLDLITQLADKSLVNVSIEDGIGRYQFLDTIHQFSGERLQESEEFDRVRQRHAEFFLNLAETSFKELWGKDQEYWLQNLKAERDNLRLALESLSSSEGEEDSVLRMAGSLWRFWEICGYFSEGRRYLEHALDINPNAEPYLRAKGLRGLGMLACQQGDYSQAEILHAESLSIFSKLEHKPGVGRELSVLGEIAWQQGNYQRALELQTESLALRYEIKDHPGIAASLGHLGNMARDRGRFQYANELLEESLKIRRELGNELDIALALNSLGLVAHEQCEYERAKSLFQEALSIYLKLGDQPGKAKTLQNLGNIARDQGDFNRAKMLFDECLGIRKDNADTEGIAQTTGSLAMVAFFQGNYVQAIVEAEKSLSLYKELGVKRGTILAMEILAFVANYQGDYGRSISLAKKSHDQAVEIKSPRQIAYAKMLFGLNEYAHGNLKEANDYFQESRMMFSGVGDRRNAAHALVNLARTAYRLGDAESSMAYLEESLSISGELGIKWSLAFSLEIKGLLLRSAGDTQGAFELFVESLEISVEQNNLQGIDNCLGALAGLAVMAGQGELAAHFFAFTERVREEVGVKLSHHDQEEYSYFLALMRDQLDETSFNSAWSEGRLMRLEQVLDELMVWKESQPFR